MAFILRNNDRSPGPDTPGVARRWVLPPGRLPDDRVTLEVVRLDSGAVMHLDTSVDELLWFQVLDGQVHAGGEPTGPEFVVMIAGGQRLRIDSPSSATVLVARVPHAAEYDPVVRDGLVCRVDWSTEPVLDSEHDSRRRIYLASTGLWGTEAVKGEMIFYPPGAAGAPHHHEGAEHFQFVLSGTGTALLEGTPVLLEPGDLLYNLENEVHAFENNGDEDFVFVEFFVPGLSRTVWVPGVNVCTWRPRETDVHGRPAARTLEAHVHGQGRV